MKLSDFDFDLPEGLIATRPANPRTAARLLVATGGDISDRHIHDLPRILRPGDRLVLNDTKVIPARLFGERIRTGDQGRTRAGIAFTLLSALANGDWQALAKPARRMRPGEVIEFGDTLHARLIAKEEGAAILRFNQTGAAFKAAIEEIGDMPLPPYIAALRAVDERDKTDYQSVFAARSGAVAAPTASLHFDRQLLGDLAQRGVQFSSVTLHVGAGTFLPVKTDDLSQHRMHSEWGEIGDQAADEINETRRLGHRVIPVGTTALRLIESAVPGGTDVRPFKGETDIFIRPGSKIRIASGLLTNFHLPRSTLLMLVSALMGKARIDAIYRHAIQKKYRFFSYGDASLLFPPS